MRLRQQETSAAKKVYACVQRERAQLKQNELQGLYTDDFTVPCVVGVDEVSSSELSISTDTDNAEASIFSRFDMECPKGAKGDG